MPPQPRFILALSSHRRENAPKLEQDFVAPTLLVIRPLVSGLRARRHTARGFVALRGGRRERGSRALFSEGETSLDAAHPILTAL